MMTNSAPVFFFGSFSTTSCERVCVGAAVPTPAPAEPAHTPAVGGRRYPSLCRLRHAGSTLQVGVLPGAGTDDDGDKGPWGLTVERPTTEQAEARG